MAEFKVGDRVKVIGVDMEFMDRPYVGKTGTIYRISGYPFPYHVKFDDGDEHCFNPECLRKIDAGNFKVGDRVKWTYRQYSETGVIVKNDGSDRQPWYVKRDVVGDGLNDNLWLNTDQIELIDSYITEYHGFHVGDVVAVRGSGFTGKIAEFSNANRPGGITVVVMNDRSERRGITTTDIEKAIVKRVFNVGDWVKITEQAPQTLSTAAVHIGKVDKVSEVIFYKGEWLYKVQLYFYPTHSLIAAQAPKESKPESTRLKVGDRVRVVKDLYEDSFIGKTGVIVKVAKSSVTFLVRFDDGDVSIGNDGTRWFYVDELVKIEDVKPMENKIKVGDTVKITSIDNTGTREFIGRTEVVKYVDYTRTFPIGIDIEKRGLRWFTEVCLKKVEDAKPVDDWRARFEAFKVSHPVGTKVKIAKKVTDDEHAELWVASMDKTVGRIGVIESYDSGNVYAIRISSCPSEFSWNYPIDALEDVTETNQYTFTVKPSDVDLDRIWRESNADFAVVVDTDNKFHSVWILYRSMGGFKCMSVQRETANDIIKRLKEEYENEKKQRVTVTIY